MDDDSRTFGAGAGIAVALRHLDDCVQRLDVARRQLELQLGDAQLIRVEDRVWVSSVPLSDLRCVAETVEGRRCANLVEHGRSGEVDELTGAFLPEDGEAFLAQRCSVHAGSDAPDVVDGALTPVPGSFPKVAVPGGSD